MELVVTYKIRVILKTVRFIDFLKLFLCWSGILKCFTPSSGKYSLTFLKSTPSHHKVEVVYERGSSFIFWMNREEKWSVMFVYGGSINPRKVLSNCLTLKMKECGWFVASRQDVPTQKSWPFLSTAKRNTITTFYRLKGHDCPTLRNSISVVLTQIFYNLNAWCGFGFHIFIKPNSKFCLWIGRYFGHRASCHKVSALLRQNGIANSVTHMIPIPCPKISLKTDILFQWSCFPHFFSKFIESLLPILSWVLSVGMSLFHCAANSQWTAVILPHTCATKANSAHRHWLLI